ncbi:MAG TPA: hemolysin family protein [Patescibacteria group bacterium]|nr:hemolysin family protein [Patescibacteria group bacterium]
MEPASDGIGTEIAIICILIIANGLFSMSEMAIISSRRGRLERMADKGISGAKMALKLAEDSTRMLASVQVGITLIGILTGAYGGATVSHEMTPYIKKIPGLEVYSDSISLFLVVTVITFLSLVVGELVPKRMALNNPETVACLVSRPMGVFLMIIGPVASFLSQSTSFILKLFGFKVSQEQEVTEEEVKFLIEQGTETGTFELAEKEMVDRVFRFGDLKISALMTPRTQWIWLDLDDPDEENLKIIRESPHTRFPAARGSLDEFSGIVFVKDLLLAGMDTGAIQIEKHIREPLFVPKFTSALKTLEMFKASGTHEAIVMDEYGGVLGLVTMHDILEELVGELPMPDEAAEERLVLMRDDGSWLIDGMLSVEEFKEIFDLEELPEEDRDNYNTVGGFITSYMGRIPSEAEFFHWGGLRFEVLDMDRLRVDKILVSLLPDEVMEEEEQ